MKPSARSILSTLSLLMASMNAAAKPPNVLVVIADDIGTGELRAFRAGSSPARTPVLDSLIARGLTFTSAYSNPTCSPTRAEIMTGRYPIRHRVGSVIRKKNGSWQLPDDEITLPERLGPAGYRTAAFGKWHLAHHGDDRAPNDAGFDHYEGTPNGVSDYFAFVETRNGARSSEPVTTYNTTEIVNDALAWLGDSDSPESPPWFVWLAFNAPHAAVQRVGQVFQSPPNELLSEPLPDDPTARQRYEGSIEAMDTELGRISEAIDLERTVLIFIGDNGVPYGVSAAPASSSKIKKTPFEGGIHVPLVVVGAGVAHGRCGALVKVADLFSTILDIADAAAERPDDRPIDAVSLTPYLSDPDHAPLRDHIVAEMFEPNGPAPSERHSRVVRYRQWKLVSARELAPFRKSSGEMFFDLDADPEERRDLLRRPKRMSPEQRAALTRCRSLLEEHLDKAAPREY